MSERILTFLCWKEKQKTEERLKNNGGGGKGNKLTETQAVVCLAFVFVCLRFCSCFFQRSAKRRGTGDCKAVVNSRSYSRTWRPATGLWSLVEWNSTSRLQWLRGQLQVGRREEWQRRNRESIIQNVSLCIRNPKCISTLVTLIKNQDLWPWSTDNTGTEQIFAVKYVASGILLLSKTDPQKKILLGIFVGELIRIRIILNWPTFMKWRYIAIY